MTIPPELKRRLDAILAQPAVVGLRQVMDAYDKAGGGLLASGLAYRALFATLTGLLFAVGVIGFVINDVAEREALVLSITSQFPPLESIVRDSVAQVSSNAGALSLIGLAGLGWSASQFYVALDVAFARVFRMTPQRGQLIRIARGLVAVAVVMTGLAGAIVISSLQSIVMSGLPSGPAGDASRVVATLLYPFLSVVLVVAAVALMFRLIPNRPVAWRALIPPAIVAGLVLTAMTELFVFLAPRLVGALSVFGGFAAIFATLIWFSWAFQVLLIGAAWVRERVGMDAVRARPLGDRPGGD